MPVILSLPDPVYFQYVLSIPMFVFSALFLFLGSFVKPRVALAAEVIARTLRARRRRVSFPLRMALLVALLGGIQRLKRLLSR